MSLKKPTIIREDNIEGLIENLEITALGYLSVRVYFPGEQRWINYIWKKGVESIVQNINLQLIEEIGKPL
jgi:hypothetical protein